MENRIICNSKAGIPKTYQFGNGGLGIWLDVFHEHENFRVQIALSEHGNFHFHAIAVLKMSADNLVIFLCGYYFY